MRPTEQSAALKLPGKKTLAILLVLLWALALFSFIMMNKGSSEVAPNGSETAPNYGTPGYYVAEEGIVDAKNELLVAGDFEEAVATDDYVLAADIKGTLTLTKIDDKTDVQVSDRLFANQLKVIGDDFGYLQQHGESQFITFLDPESAEISIMKTSDSIATWDTNGNSISYHPYETGILGFAEYDNALGWDDVREIDAQLITIGGMFSSGDDSYVWVVNDMMENHIYDGATQADVTKQFPVIQKTASINGTLADVVTGFWVVTVPGESGARKTSQVWNDNGDKLTDLGVVGYNLTGKGALSPEGELFLPVSYTNGQTPDGVLVAQADISPTDFIEDIEAYVSKG